jgi:hypothetical protein
MDGPFQFPKYFQCSDTDKIFFTLSMDLTGFSSAFPILIRSPTRILSWSGDQGVATTLRP